MIRIREPDLGKEALDSLIAELAEITADKALLMCNFRNSNQLERNLALGIHYPEMIPREMFPANLRLEERVVGRSIHSMETALDFNKAPVDYLTYGTVFASKTHPGGPTQGLQNLAQIVGASIRPILAIGGIQANNVAEVMSTGAYGISVIGSISEAKVPLDVTKELVEIANLNFSRIKMDD